MDTIGLAALAYKLCAPIGTIAISNQTQTNGSATPPGPEPFTGGATVVTGQTLLPWIMVLVGVSALAFM